MAVVRRIPCVVDALEDHGERVYTVHLRLGVPAPRFKPGQFLHLALDPYEPGGFWPESRVFSIASPPAVRELLTVTYAVKGDFTGRMERELSVGSAVWVKLPYGEFVVDAANDVVLFAGGTGVTAFTAFLHSLMSGGASRVLLCYGARCSELFVYEPLVEECKRRAPGFEARLFAEDRDGRLNVEAVWDAVTRLCTPSFYLSGPPSMLRAISAELSDHGVLPAAVKTDAWE